MAVQVVKLNSGFDMPVIGLGTWQVRRFIAALASCNFAIASRPACGVHPYAIARASNKLANGEDDVLST